MEVQMEAKKAWTKPVVTLYGSVEKITQQINKVAGTSDGLLLAINQNTIIPIGFAS